MSRFQKWSLRAYRRLLTLYPEDLRREFGEEMLEEFGCDLQSDGLLRAWRIALRETVQIGFPEWCQNPAVAVPILSAAFALLSQTPLFIVALRKADPLVLADVLAALSLQSVITALTAFVAVYRWKHDRYIRLDL